MARVQRFLSKAQLYWLMLSAHKLDLSIVPNFIVLVYNKNR